MNTLSERLFFLSQKYRSARDFALKSGVDPTSMLAYLGRRKLSKPTSDVLLKIIQETKCDGHWLLTGNGTPYQIPRNSTQLNQETHLDFDKIRKLPAGLLTSAVLVRNFSKIVMVEIEKGRITVDLLISEIAKFIDYASQMSSLFEGEQLEKMLINYYLMFCTYFYIICIHYYHHPILERLRPFISYFGIDPDELFTRK